MKQYRMHPLMKYWLEAAEDASQACETQISKVLSEWVPAVDIHEEKDNYTMLLEIPGVDPNDLDIAAEGHKLTIRGDKKAQCGTQDTGCQHMERRYGQFVREFTLPERVDVSDIKAKTKNGVLSLILPKRPEHVSKAIKISIE